MLLFCYIGYQIFLPLYQSEHIIVDYGLHPFDICMKQPVIWKYVKVWFIVTFVFASYFFSNLFYRFLSKILSFIPFSNSITNTSQKEKRRKEHKNKTNSYSFINSIRPQTLELLVGQNEKTKEFIYLPEKSLYQNIFITGTIGTGKTSSAMYPFTKQLIKYNFSNPSRKLGMLILDVKGNYYKQVLEYVNKYNLFSDLIVISLNSNTFYNPLHKPNLKPQVLANRLKTILTLFSENNSESYWLDKAEAILSECIKLCRLYNNGYVTFLELHKLITIPNYYKEKISILKDLFISSKLSQKDIYDLNSSLDFFQKEFDFLDQRTKAILISEITRITNTFISDYDVMSTFCPPISKLSFIGFSQVLSAGKIVVLNMNISEYSLLSRIIATYLKLDFQTEVMSNLSKDKVFPSAFICDEYDKFASKTDSEFFSLSREAKCINIVSTQSYSSLKTTIKDEAYVKVIIQNLINKIWYRTDDIFTIEEVQKQLGKEDKEKFSKSISESAKETRFSYITNSLNSENSNISETFSTYMQNDYIFDTNFFTQKLQTFTALTFLSDGNKIYTPCKLNMIPYFKKN